MSETCYRQRPPIRPLVEYWSEREARAAATRAEARVGRPFRERPCCTCGRYHIKPVVEYCTTCHGSNREPKRAYRTEAEAKEVAVSRREPLDVYECPVGQGFHLTKKSR